MTTTLHILLCLCVIGLAVGVRILASRAADQGKALGRGGPTLLAGGKLSLSPQHTLQLVQVGNRLLVLALYAGGCSMIASFPADHWEPPESRIGSPK
ncbi:MAG: flagellar biosynthetic protein FliO [Bryobacterales bacterium]|nr:flagellar biosynthetic protein FliO [Bryobacterales bacterium]